MTGSKELARSVMLARNARWFSGAILAPAAVSFLAVTSFQAAGTVIHNFLYEQPITWDIARMPAVALGTVIGSQSPSFLANNFMVHTAKGEDSTLSDIVMDARKWRNRKRVAEAVGITMLPTFWPEGLKGSVFSGIPLTLALAFRLVEASYNSEAHRGADLILHPEKAKPRRMVSV